MVDSLLVTEPNCQGWSLLSLVLPCQSSSRAPHYVDGRGVSVGPGGVPSRGRRAPTEHRGCYATSWWMLDEERMLQEIWIERNRKSLSSENIFLGTNHRKRNLNCRLSRLNPTSACPVEWGTPHPAPVWASVSWLAPVPRFACACPLIRCPNFRSNPPGFRHAAVLCRCSTITPSLAPRGNT